MVTQGLGTRDRRGNQNRGVPFLQSRLNARSDTVNLAARITLRGSNRELALAADSVAPVICCVMNGILVIWHGPCSRLAIGHDRGRNARSWHGLG
jgi:hypothetical protein